MYFQESKKHRSIIKKYIRSMMGYSDAQVDRLIAQKKQCGRIVKCERTQPIFPRIYTADDVALLIVVDNAEQRRTGGALKKTLLDMHTVYGDQKFEQLSKISVSHIYNLRGTR